MVDVYCVLLKELTEILAAHGDRRCGVQVQETDDFHFDVTIRVPCPGQDTAEAELDVLELYHRLRFLAGLGQVRAFASEYGIHSKKLEAALHRE
jgi:hypothetical protein